MKKQNRGVPEDFRLHPFAILSISYANLSQGQENQK